MDTPGTPSAPSSAPKTYLVTGAAGFVGSEITRHLLARGDRVRAMARRSGQLDGMDHPNLDKVIGDVRDADALRKHAQGMDGIFHIAALFRQANVPDQAYWDTNVQGTRNVMDAAIAAGNLRMIYCSTCGVHGHLENPPADETAPYAPCDIYQETKVEAEKLVLEAYRSGRLPGVVIRPAMIYGPGDTRFRKMFRMIAKRRFFYVGAGDTLVHYLDNRDLARAFLLAMDHTERNGQAYIIAGERSMTLREFCEIVAAQLGVPPPWLRLPHKPMQMLGGLCEAVCVPLRIPPPLYRRRVDFYAKDRAYNIAKARAELDYRPALTLEEEVRDVIADYRQRGWL